MKALAGAFRSVADCAYTKNGRPAPKYILGGYKWHGRPPAGSIKGAALRILTSITQRQQGQRASATPVQIEKQAV
jgi:hypothetical protein